jgi:hypothetical protein
MSLYAKGKVLGVAAIDQVNKKTGEHYQIYRLVLQTPKHGGLQGQTIDEEYQLTKRQLESGAEKRLNDLKGQQVLIEVFGSHRAYKDRVYSDWFLAGDAVPVTTGKAA